MVWGKPYVEDVEREFKTDKLKDKHVYHDLSIRVYDPEEFRRRCVEVLMVNNFKVNVNELTEFEDTEFKGFFSGGRLKPLKSIIKGVKSTSVGPKFPLLWKAFITMGLIAFIGFLMPYEELNKQLLFWASMITLFAGLFIFFIKESVKSIVWLKTVGIYDVEGIKADLRVVISADIDRDKNHVMNSLKDDIGYIYDELARRYASKIKPEEQMIKEVPQSKKVIVVEEIGSLNRQMDELREKLVTGRVSEEVYKDVMRSLEKKKSKLETILDLVTL